MKNDTTIKVPVTYENAIDELYYDSDGYWCYLKDGYHASGYGDFYSDGRVIHKDTQAEMLQQINLIKKLKDYAQYQCVMGFDTINFLTTKPLFVEPGSIWECVYGFNNKGVAVLSRMGTMGVCFLEVSKDDVGKYFKSI